MAKSKKPFYPRIRCDSDVINIDYLPPYFRYPSEINIRGVRVWNNVWRPMLTVEATGGGYFGTGYKAKYITSTYLPAYNNVFEIYLED